jgi:hypothetical protein
VLEGVRTLIAFGDDYMGSMVVAHPGKTESVIRCALRVLTVYGDWQRRFFDRNLS